jgi:hypothetical protein
MKEKAKQRRSNFNLSGSEIDLITIILKAPLSIKQVCTPSPFKNHASIMKPQTLPYRAASDIVCVTLGFSTFKCAFPFFLKITNN